jgi:hypothetical protein
LCFKRASLKAKKLKLPEFDKFNDFVATMEVAGGRFSRSCADLVRFLVYGGFRKSSVDIPTVSRWLGHKDGGELAMKVYGHLRDQHSVEMAQKGTFSKRQPENVIQMPEQKAVLRGHSGRI